MQQLHQTGRDGNPIETRLTDGIQVIGVTGMPFSGKSTLADIAESRGFTRFRMGDAIVREMEERGIEVTNRNIREFATQLREEHGRGVAAELSVPHIQELIQDGEKVVIDGIRSPEEVSIFREHFGDDMLLKCVHAPEKDRFERAMERDRDDDDFEDFEDFKWNDEQQLDWGLADTIEQADVHIGNSGDLASFRDEVARLLDRLT